MQELYPEGYEATRSALRKFAETYNRLEVEGLENIPPPGQGGLVAANHDNYSDPFYLGVAVDSRYLRFLAWGDIISWPLVGPFVEAMGAVPVPTTLGKSNDKKGSEAALQVLAEFAAQGGLAGIFPEGKIKHWLGGDALKRFKPGAVRIAAKAGVPIIPTGMYGTRWAVMNVAGFEGQKKNGEVIDKSWWSPFPPLPAKVMVKFGEAFEVNPDAAEHIPTAIAEVERLRKEIFKLRQDLKLRYPKILKKLAVP